MSLPASLANFGTLAITKGVRITHPIPTLPSAMFVTVSYQSSLANYLTGALDDQPANASTFQGSGPLLYSDFYQVTSDDVTKIDGTLIEFTLHFSLI